MGRIIGIDLGADSSAVAIPEEHSGSRFRAIKEIPGCSVILDQAGRLKMPSVMAEDANGEIIVGFPAKARASSIAFAKRYLGEDIVFHLPGHGDFRPEQVIAHILICLKQQAEEALNDSVEEAVISIPAHFSLLQAQLVHKAAEQAGLRVAQVIQEPVAAAVAYCANDPRDPLLLLTYDLGGGSFQVALLEKRDGVITLLASDGDSSLGGYDFDRELALWIIERLSEEGRVLSLNPGDPADNAVFAKLMVIAERAKVQLSITDSCLIMESLSGIADRSGEAVTIDLEITRDEFERMIEGHIELTISWCHRVISERAVSPGDIDEILLIGGSSKIPIVSRRVEEVFGRKPRLFEPDVCVAAGAAILAGEKSRSKASPVNRLSMPLSLLLADGLQVIAPQGAPLPYETVINARTGGNSGTIRMGLYQGSQSLGELMIKDLPSTLPVGSEVEIAITIEEDYQIRARARVPALASEFEAQMISAGSVHYNAPPKPEPDPYLIRLELESELARLESLAREQGCYFQFKADFERAAQSLDRIDPKAPEALSQLRDWCLAEFDSLKKHIEPPDWIGLLGGSPRAASDSTRHTQTYERESDDEERKKLAISLAEKAISKSNSVREEISKGIKSLPEIRALLDDLREAERDLTEADRLYPASDIREALDDVRSLSSGLEAEYLMLDAKEAAERGEWGRAIRLLREGLQSASLDHQSLFRKNLSVCLANRALNNINHIIEMMNSGVSGLETLRGMIDGLKASETDLLEAVKLDQSSYYARESLEKLHSILSQIEAMLDKPPKEKKIGLLRKLFDRISESSNESNADARQERLPLRRGTPEVPGPVDKVHFSVTSPSAVIPGSSFILQVWAHLERQRHIVIERSRQSVSGEIRIESKGPVHLPRSTVLCVRLKIEGLMVEDPEDTILWEGEVGNATFAVMVPKDAAEGGKRGLATIYIDGFQIAKIHFSIQVGSQSSRLDHLPAQERQHRNAFASYASADSDQVLARIQGIQKAAPELDIFLDRLKLRSGQDWEQELWKRIQMSDVFYLFWSGNARNSTWVEKEWRYALSEKGLGFIDPIPLVSPKDVPPPPELASKHFNDWVIAFMSSKGS